MADQKYAQMAQPVSTPDVVATDIPTRHKAGIWGGGITAILALIIAILALVLVFTYHSEGWTMWRTTVVTVASSAATVTPSNRTLFQIAPGALTETTSGNVAVTISGGKAGDVFGISSSGKGTGVGNLVVKTDAGDIIIPPSSAVQFVINSSGIAVAFTTQTIV